MNRRDFLQTSVAGAGGLMLGMGRDAAAAAVFDPYERVPLGRSGLTVSRLCLGTGMRGGMRASNHTRMGRDRFDALVHGAFERGINFFDLADIYGTHAFFGRAVKALPRESFVVATKIWFRPGALPIILTGLALVIWGRHVAKLLLFPFFFLIICWLVSLLCFIIKISNDRFRLTG